MRMISRRTVLLGTAGFAMLPHVAGAQDQAIRIVYSFPAGNAGDAVARLVADRMHGDLGKPVIVDNKSGAGGRIGARAVKDAPADGSSLLFAVSSQMTLQPHLYADLGYDPFADFAPVSQLMTFEQAVAVPASAAIRSIADLVAWYKANPAQAAFGSPGAGTGPHVVALEFARAFGLDLRHVPYRGTAAALPDLLAARLPAHFAASGELLEQHAAGKLRVLATGGAQRSPNLPDVPTFREAGADIQASGWYAFLAPARTPADTLKRLETAIIALAQDTALRTRIQAMGFRPTGTSADELRQIQRAEFDHWKRVVAQTGLKIEQ